MAEEDLSDEMSLSEMFEEPEPEPPAEPVKAEAKEPEPEPQGEPEPESAEPPKAAEPEAKEEPKAEPPTAEQKGQLAALIAERDKRQRLEARVKELEGELGEESEADPISDVKDQVLADKIALSRDIMSELDADYETKYEPYFMNMVVDSDGNVKDEKLLAEFRSATNPAKFARDTARKEMRFAELNSPEYELSLREKVKQELLAELKASGEITAAKVPDMTTSADAGSNSVPPVSDETVNDMSFGIDT